MKNSMSFSVSNLRKWLATSPILRWEKSRTLLLVTAAGTVMLAIAFVEKPHTSYVAHEWGTFTSVQGGDGVLLEWKPLESSRLPGFVYNWFKPGLGRQPIGPLAFTKAELLTLQRMETPVIYLYAAEPQSVDVTVKFPKGLITEWYPQASRVGPSAAKPPWLTVRLDEYVVKSGLKPGFRFASLASTTAATPDSGIRWAGVNILSPADAMTSLAKDSSGSHYFAARNTDANILKAAVKSDNRGPEHERFLFYRGVGNFETPLRVRVADKDALILENTESEPLTDLFVLRVEMGAGTFERVESLSSGQPRVFPVNKPPGLGPLPRVSRELGKEMQRSLVKHGLYAREAEAMVATWRDSWFEEDGVRVLYLLSRAWADRTLPLNLAPQPKELVRVMVGRAEVLLPSAERALAQGLRSADSGGAQAHAELVQQLRSLNRFAEPALRLATEGAPQVLKEKGWELLHLATVSQGN